MILLLSWSIVYTMQPYTMCMILQSHSQDACMFGCKHDTCSFGRMTWISYMLLWYHGGGTDTEIRVNTESWPRRNSPSTPARTQTHYLFHHESGTNPTMCWRDSVGSRSSSELCSKVNVTGRRAEGCAKTRPPTHVARSTDVIQITSWCVIVLTHFVSLPYMLSTKHLSQT